MSAVRNPWTGLPEEEQIGSPAYQDCNVQQNLSFEYLLHRWSWCAINWERLGNWRWGRWPGGHSRCLGWTRIALSWEDWCITRWSSPRIASFLCRRGLPKKPIWGQSFCARWCSWWTKNLKQRRLGSVQWWWFCPITGQRGPWGVTVLMGWLWGRRAGWRWSRTRRASSPLPPSCLLEVRST